MNGACCRQFPFFQPFVEALYYLYQAVDLIVEVGAIGLVASCCCTVGAAGVWVNLDQLKDLK
jgi:hypothetical protein